MTNKWRFFLIFSAPQKFTDKIETIENEKSEMLSAYNSSQQAQEQSIEEFKVWNIVAKIAIKIQQCDQTYLMERNHYLVLIIILVLWNICLSDNFVHRTIAILHYLFVTIFIYFNMFRLL